MNVVLIGGHSRNIGKTSVVEGLIRGLPEYAWTAVKITQHGHGICAVNGKACGCAPGEHLFAIDEELHRDTGADSSRFLAAGARRSLWVRTKQGELFTVLEALEQAIAPDDFVIIESNSLRRFLKPNVYLQILDPAQPDFKLSAQEFFDFADAYLVVARSPREKMESVRDNWKNVSLAREIKKGKPHFLVTPEERFVNSTVVNFVRSRLEDSKPASRMNSQI